MQFLVIGKNIDSGYLLPPEQVVAALEGAVVPSFQMLAGMENEGRVKGGTFPGERAGAFVIDVESYEELDQLMNGLPFFGLVKWDIKPLMPFRSIAGQLPQYIQNFRNMGQQGG